VEEQIYGLSMRDCAEIMSKDGELKAQYGEPAHRAHLQHYLASRGTDENTWAHSWNGWWSRMESDPSGQLHAKFAMIQQELTMKAHFGDVADMSQQAHEGVTLDTYARLMAKAAGGEDLGVAIQQAGLSWEQWQRGQAAWNAAMAADVNHHITTQYGQLYAKYTPGFQQQMQGQIAAVMAADHAQRAAGRPDEPEREYTFDDMVRELSDPTPNKRWTAAHHIANRWDIGDKNDPQLKAAASKAFQLALECLERHDDFTVSNAESLARDSAMFANTGLLTFEQASDCKGAIQRCWNRANERLQTLRAAFAPSQNKAVPERIQMQSAIQDYTSLVGELQTLNNDWDSNFQAPEAASSFSAPSSFGAPAASAFAPAPAAIAPSGGGLIGFLKMLPIIGNILRLLGL
jgi:hypothetical protein